MTQQNNSEEVQSVYVCEKYAGFQFRAETTRFRFEKHQLILTDVDLIAEMDAAIAKHPAIAGKVKKVDYAAAEALVKNHQKTHGGAHSGPFGSNAMAGNEANKIDTRDDSLAKMPPAEKKELLAALAKESDLILTEKSKVTEVPKQPIAPINPTKPTVLVKPAIKINT